MSNLQSNHFASDLSVSSEPIQPQGLLKGRDTVVPLSKSPEAADSGAFEGTDPSGEVAVLSNHILPGSHAEQIPANVPYSVRYDQCRCDCITLTAMQLRSRYPSEANSHRNMLARRKTEGRIVHPAFLKFAHWLSHVGPQPTRTSTFDRIDPFDPEYAPGKTRWLDKPGQTNNRTNTHLFTLSDGSQYTAAELSKLLKVPEDTLRKRRARGWSDDEVFAGRRLPGSRFMPTSPVPVAQRGSKRRHIDVIWLQTLDETYPGECWTLMPPDRTMLKSIEKVLDEEGLGPHIEDIVTYGLQNWPDLTEYADDHFRAYPLPPFPTVRFVHKNVISLVGIWLRARKLRFIDRRLVPELPKPPAPTPSQAPAPADQDPKELYASAVAPKVVEPMFTLADLYAPVNPEDALA